MSIFAEHTLDTEGTGRRGIGRAGIVSAFGAQKLNKQTDNNGHFGCNFLLLDSLGNKTQNGGHGFVGGDTDPPVGDSSTTRDT